eukprot:jgi/Botrbrau1/13482/Bobra.0082s0078.1
MKAPKFVNTWLETAEPQDCKFQNPCYSPPVEELPASTGGAEGGSMRIEDGESSNMPPAVCPLSKLLAIARSSPFAFASGELEADFQTHDARAISLLSWFCALVTVTGYFVLFAKIAAASGEQRALLPDMLLPVLFQFLPTVAVLALGAFFPSFYAAHKQALHLATHCCILVVFHSTRQLVLWMRMVKGSSLDGSFTKAAQFFSDENLYLSVVWYSVPAFPFGLCGEFAVVLAWLLVNLTGNTGICTSPLWTPDAVTLSSGPVTAVRRVSPWVLEVPAPLYALQAQPELSCESNLAFWQILGSWLACLAVCVAEVLRRREFLRTPAAQARLGRQFAAAALRWPFGSSQLGSNCICGLFLLTVGHCLVWAVVLGLLSP